MVILAHGGGGGSMADMLLGIAPVLIGTVLIGLFVILLGFEMSRNNGYRDNTPSPGRQMFDGDYDWSNLMLKNEVDTAFDPVQRAAMMERGPMRQ